MDKIKASNDIISYALPLVPFDGWNQQTLGKAALAAGYKKTDVIRVFSGGAIDAVDAYSRMVDEQMMESLSHYHLDSMKIRERITTAIRLRLELQTPNREAVRKAIAMHSLPFYAHRGLRALYETVDNIWYGIGDKSTDFNFYSKRLTLAAVYSSTLVVWLDDHSAGHEATWAFLDRRVEDVMKIEKTKYKVKSWFKKARVA
ncbi:MAG: COQ9 family protein [Rickettsiales bacterium]|jgi:ubiquinone biosynthesis protein COQ9